MSECLTGVVLDADGSDDDAAPVTVDLGASPIPPSPECEVVVSFFAPDALYRLSATAVPHNGSGEKVIDLRVHEVQRVQRRQAPRARLEYQAVLSNFDDPGAMVSVVGRTIDLGEGGCRITTSAPFPPGCDPTITITEPDGETIVALGAILQSAATEDGYEYRLVFLEIDDEDRDRLSELVTTLAAA